MKTLVPDTAGVEASRELADQASVGVVTWQRKRDIDAAFEAHPAVTAYGLGMCHRPVGNRGGPDNGLGSGCVTSQELDTQLNRRNGTRGCRPTKTGPVVVGHWA